MRATLDFSAKVANLACVMGVSRALLNTVVTAFLITSPSYAGAADLDELFSRLQADDLPDWEQVEQQIWAEWSQSGSASMDLLLQRGREAMEDGNFEEAIDHFTALTDHAPDFAEGWNARATAYFQADRYELSIADIQRTLALNPRHFGALQGLGRILEELNDPENALVAYEMAFAIHPHRPGLEDRIEQLRIATGGQDL